MDVLRLLLTSFVLNIKDHFIFYQFYSMNDQFILSHFFYTESYLRRCIKPLEALLTSHKRLVVKDSAVSEKLFSDH